jgi:hypothetical protein
MDMEDMELLKLVNNRKEGAGFVCLCYCPIQLCLNSCAWMAWLYGCLVVAVLVEKDICGWIWVS